MNSSERYYARKDNKASRPGNPRFVVIDRISNKPVCDGGGIGYTFDQAQKTAQRWNWGMNQQKRYAESIGYHPKITHADCSDSKNHDSGEEALRWAVDHPSILKELRSLADFAGNMDTRITTRDIQEVLHQHWIESLPFPAKELLPYI